MPAARYEQRAKHDSARQNTATVDLGDLNSLRISVHQAACFRAKKHKATSKKHTNRGIANPSYGIKLNYDSVS